MFVEPYSVLLVAGTTVLKILPISIAMGIVFAALTRWSPAIRAGRGGASGSSPMSATGS